MDSGGTGVASASVFPVGIVAFVSGLLLGSWLSILPVTVLVLLIVLAGALSRCERTALLSAGRGLMIYACLLLGLGYWALNERHDARADVLSVVEPRVLTVSGVVAAPVAHSPGRITMIVAVRSVETDGASRPASGRLRLTWRNPDTEVFRGDRVSVRARVRPPFGTRNPGGFDYGRYLRDHGIRAVATVKGPHRIRVRPPDAGDVGARIWRRIDRWRHRVRQAAIATFDQPARGLFLGMIVGEQRDIPARVREDFMTTGTVHIISISGSHLGLLAVVSFFGVRGLARRLPPSRLETLSCILTPKQLAVLVTIPLVVFYTLLSGSHVATVRSLIMLLLYLFAVWIGHERHILIALSLAALLTTLVDPRAIYDLSFQLSYVSVLAIALGARWSGRDAGDAEGIRNAGGIGDADDADASLRLPVKLRHWARRYLVMTIAATLSTVPLVAYYFNQVAWMGLAANAIVVPLVGLVVVPLGLGASLLVLLGGLTHLPASGVQQEVMHGLTAFIGAAASMPGARWHVASPSVLAMAGFYLCLFAAFFGRARVLRWVSAGLVALCLCWWVWSPRHPFEADALRVTFLDVGQGDATVIELPDGQTALVDGGAAYERWDMGQMAVGPYLWDQGIRRLDHVIATHPQLDHIGGLPWIFNHFEIGRYWGNGVHRRKPFVRALERAGRDKGLVEHIAWAGRDLVDEGGCRIRSLNPPPAERGRMAGDADGADLNNLSVVLSVTCGAHSILLTADAEVDALERLTEHPLVQSATVVKIPHHGAKSSLNPRWIARLNATAAVVSAGQGNRYGHPAPAVVGAYRDRRMRVYRTDVDGAVLVVADPDSGARWIRRARDRHPVPLAWARYSLARERENLFQLWNLWVRNA